MVQAMEKASGKKVGQLYPSALTSTVPRAPPTSLAPSPAPPPASVLGACPCASEPGGQPGGRGQAGSAKPQLLPRLQIPYKVVARREGDVAACYANPSLALKELGWTAVLGLDRMCEFSPQPRTLGAGLTRGRGAGAGQGLPGSEHAHPGLPEMVGVLHSNVDPHSTPPPPQVKTCGAGRSRILQASAHRPDPPLLCTRKGKRTACSPASGGNPGPRPPLPQTPAGPSQPTRHEARAPLTRSWGGSLTPLQQGPGTHQDHQK